MAWRPAISSVLTNPNLRKVSQPAEVWATELDYAWCAPRLPGMFEMEQALGNEINKAVVGQASPKEALDAGVKAWREIMDKNGFYRPSAAGRLSPPWPMRPGSAKARRRRCDRLDERMIRKSGRRFSEKIMRTTKETQWLKPSRQIRDGRRTPPVRRYAGGALSSAGPFLIFSSRRQSSTSWGSRFYPGLYAIYQSLFRVRFNSWTFIGLDNYTKLLGDQEFWASLWNTFLIGSGRASPRIRDRAHPCCPRLPRPLDQELAHPLSLAHAVHALGRLLHLEARFQ